MSRLVVLIAAAFLTLAAASGADASANRSARRAADRIASTLARVALHQQAVRGAPSSGRLGARIAESHGRLGQAGFVSVGYGSTPGPLLRVVPLSSRILAARVLRRIGVPLSTLAHPAAEYTDGTRTARIDLATGAVRGVRLPPVEPTSM